jgi:hypothetical protein
MVDKNDSLMREVDDELRREQISKLWDQYGTYVIGGVVAFVGAVAVFQGIESGRKSAAETAGASYDAARRLNVDKKATEATAAFADIAKNGPTGYASLARLQAAGAAAKADKIAEAVAGYDAIVADANADSILRDVARLQAAALRTGVGDWTEMQNRLTPLVDERNAFRAPARELLGLAASAAGKSEDARRLFLQILGDGKASASLKDRVNGYMIGLVAAEIAKPEADKAAAPAGAVPEAPKTGDATKK